MADESTEKGTDPGTTARFPQERWEALAARVAPILRERNETVGAEDDDFADSGVMDMADTGHLIDALYAAGVLTLDDSQDRAHLRRSWAGMSTALYYLAKDRPLTPDVLAAVPESHRFYLMGHEAGHNHLAQAWARLIGAREVLDGLLSRGTTPTPPELGAVVATLGGENPYAGGRPPIADPWWGCWTDPAAAPESFRWEDFRRTCAPDQVLSGLGDLCAFLGGTWSETLGGASVTAMVLHLIVKAQNTPEKFAAIERAFPREVTAWRIWNPMSPSPTAGELYTELAGAERAALLRAGTVEQGPVLASVVSAPSVIASLSSERRPGWS